ncbi:biotin--protein ligase [Pseudoclavibacter endophyticus]|nr:biotin--protein ligase [Pseudoclavibacter endophyticus]
MVRLDESPSTNDEVRRRWAADDSGRALPHLSSVTTESQTAGRGRLGRQWVSPPGASLAVSTILRLDGGAGTWLGWIPLVAGLALRDALIDLLGHGSAATGERDAQYGAGDRVRLKWPNDVLVDGGKIAGILGEVLGARDDELAVVIGCGINLRFTREELPVPHATSLLLAGVDPIDGTRVERRYLAALTRRIDALTRAGGDAVEAGLFDDFTAACETLGQRVRVALPGDTAVVGAAERIDARGQLVVRDDAGTAHTIAAGDVQRVRPAES